MQLKSEKKWPQCANAHDSIKQYESYSWKPAVVPTHHRGFPVVQTSAFIYRSLWRINAVNNVREQSVVYNCPWYWVLPQSDAIAAGRHLSSRDGRWWLVRAFVDSTWNQWNPRADAAEEEPDENQWFCDGSRGSRWLQLMQTCDVTDRQ